MYASLPGLLLGTYAIKLVIEAENQCQFQLIIPALDGIPKMVNTNEAPCLVE